MMTVFFMKLPHNLITVHNSIPGSCRALKISINDIVNKALEEPGIELFVAINLSTSQPLTLSQKRFKLLTIEFAS